MKKIKTQNDRNSDHHRQCRSNGGKTTKENLSKVSELQHRAFHTLFLNKDTYGIAQFLNEVWIDPRFELVVKSKSTQR